MANGNQNFYTNPAFCQQSEFYSQRRQPPVGAHKPISTERYHPPGRVVETPPKVGPKPKDLQRRNSVRTNVQNDNEEDLNEMLVDEPYFLQTRDNEKYLDISNGNARPNRYSYLNGNIPSGAKPNYEDDQNGPSVRKGRYAVVPMDEEEESPRSPKHRYEYIPMKEQPSGYPSSPPKQPKPTQEEIEIVQGRIHRYSVIPGDEEPSVPSKTGRYALVPVSEIKPNSRYAIIPAEDLSRSAGRYDYLPEEGAYPENHRRTTVPTHQEYYTHPSLNPITSPQTPRKANHAATQKLHELLTTPKKIQRTSTARSSPQNVLSPQSQRRIATPPQPVDLFRTPNKTPPKSSRLQTPKAQQKLNYTLSTRQQVGQENKRHTAVIAPICSSPVQSVYSETTFSHKTESWMNLSLQKPPVQATLAVAAVMMTLCGGLTSALCFYMVSVVGRMYYLDFGIVSGFACLLLGLLGFRSRNCHWLPNRNYISGYIVLSAFSLLTCAGLLVLLFLQPKPGSPLADVTSGAVCGISGLSLILASAGVIASYCCKYPPPDNRVQHCAPGFTV